MRRRRRTVGQVDDNNVYNEKEDKEDNESEER